MARSDRIAPTVTLRDQVYDRLREDIRAGAFPTGHRFVELDLADRYGVSRTPIREALLQLAREGTLDHAGRGYVLPEDSRKHNEDRLAVRLLLDVAVVRGAAERADERERRELRRLYDRAVKAHQADRAKTFAKTQQEFRQLLRTSCGNAVLARYAEMVDDSFQQVRARLYEDGANREVTLAGDLRLIEAIENRNPDAAEAQTRTFLERVRAFYRQEEGD